MSAPAPAHTVGDLLAIVRRHRWILIIITAFGLTAGTGYWLLAPSQYVSQTSVLVQPTGAENGAVAQGRTKTEINLDTEAQLVKSTEVATLAAERLAEVDVPPADLARQVSVTVPPNTSILTIGFTADGPYRAQAGAEAFASAYLSHRADSARERLTDQVNATDEELETLRAEREDLSDRLDRLNPNSSRYAGLRHDRDLLDNEIAELTADSSRLRSAADSVGSGKIISEAALPTASTSPHLFVSMSSGTLIGLLLAVCVVAVRVRFAVRVWHPSDVTRRCGIEVLAALPALLESKTTDVFGAFGPAGRVFGRLRNEVVASLDEPPQVIVVAGVATGSASSIVTANLAAALARSGETATAVSTHPGGGVSNVASLLGTRPVPGLSDVLADRVGFDAAVQRAARQPSLTVIGPGGCATAGGPSREAMSGVYERLRDRSSYIVVDAAPMAVSSDAQLLASNADAVILVVECGRDRIDEVTEAVQAVQRIDAPLLGAVVLPRHTIPAAPVAAPATEELPALTRRPAPHPRPGHIDGAPADDTPTETMPTIDDSPSAIDSMAPGRGRDL